MLFDMKHLVTCNDGIQIAQNFSLTTIWHVLFMNKQATEWPPKCIDLEIYHEYEVSATQR